MRNHTQETMKTAHAVFETIAAPRFIIGRCAECKWWKDHQKTGVKGECMNESKIHEPDYHPTNETDHFIYSYNEGGGFTAGKDFGCVHWTDA